jgi:hypothetical protein
MLHAALEVEFVMDLWDGGVVREAIEKLQGPDGRLEHGRQPQILHQGGCETREIRKSEYQYALQVAQASD